MHHNTDITNQSLQSAAALFEEIVSNQINSHQIAATSERHTHTYMHACRERERPTDPSQQEQRQEQQKNNKTECTESAMNHTGSIQARPQPPSRATVTSTTSSSSSSMSDAQVLAPPDAFIDESLAIGPAAGTFSEENPAADNNHSHQKNHNTATTVTTTIMMKKRKVCHDYHDHANDTDAKATEASVAPTVSSEDDDENQLCVQQSANVSNNNNNNNGPPTKKRRGPRGGVAQPFPEKLFEMLASVEKEGFSPIVSWQPHGRCFVVHNPKEFVSKVMPFYFRQTKLTSFQRQLNLYGFCRLTSGKDRGGYYHELFLRGRPFLCKRMMRTRIKGTGIKAASSPNTEVCTLQTTFHLPMPLLVAIMLIHFFSSIHTHTHTHIA